MPGKSFPLVSRPYFPARPPQPRSAHLHRPHGTRTHPPAAAPPSLVYWPAVAAAGGLAVVLVGIVLVWVITHPTGKTRSMATLTPPVTPVSLPAITETTERPPVQLPRADDLAESFVIRRAAEKEPPAAPPTPPPAPPHRAAPAEVPVPQAAPAGRPAGETYGTSVTFLGNPEEAAELARRDKKLLFVLHVSGNFEDSCFT
jgi:hypothetical protein